MIFSCEGSQPAENFLVELRIETGAERVDAYINKLKDKKVGIVGNQSSLIQNTHLVDSLLSLGVDVVKVFSPEHGFRGKADAGETVKNDIDSKTGLPLISLYGKNKKPTASQLEGVDILVFDIQDVGVRFYTYISTLHYVMEAAAENDVAVLILDRPNPNGHYVDGPVLDLKYKSFVGMHQVPIVHGMTIAEYGQMINGEGWLSNGVKCDLDVISCGNYDHQKFYSLPVPPSPNLRTDLSIQLYPSLCLLEATTVSCGRGTDYPFEQYGHPEFKETGYSFTPKSGPGSKSPKHMDKLCHGFNLRDSILPFRADALDFSHLVKANEMLDGKLFVDRSKFFNLLAGNGELLKQLEVGLSEEKIRASWEPELEAYKKMRIKYLMYPI